MSINIKEIFQSDNLSVSQDKINYNFDQILANGGGPQGLKGDKGTTGALGSIGPKGDKGEIGSAGPKGNTGADGYWDLETYINPIDQHTLIPKIQPTSGSTTGDKPTNIVLGRTNSSYTENAIDKSSLLTLVDENGGSDWTNLINFRLKTGASFNPASINIRLVPINAGSGAKLRLLADGGSSAEFEIQADLTTFKDASSNIILEIENNGAHARGYWGFLAGSEININATGILNNNGNSNLLGNNVLGDTGKTNTITGTNTINGAALKINTTGSLPAANKILVAQDTNGTSLWKNPTDIVGIYPIGSIIFVNPADISDTYFSLTTYQFNTFTPGLYRYSYFGRGVVGTRWAGWYLLFGQTNQWSSALNTNVSYIPTNIPGSLIMGASGPDNKLGVVQDKYDSSMATGDFNPPVGYGTSYLPSIRGSVNGAGSQGVTGPGSVNDPGDLLTNWGYNPPSGPGYASNYDILDASMGAQGGVLNDAGLQQESITQNYIYPINPAIHALPMAIYLGSPSLAYNWILQSGTPAGPAPSFSPPPGGFSPSPNGVNGPVSFPQGIQIP